jgi:hypothetical protein
MTGGERHVAHARRERGRHECSSCRERTRQPWARVSAMPLAAAKPALRVVRQGTESATQAADLGAVGARAAARGRVDHQLHLARGDHGHGVHAQVGQADLAHQVATQHAVGPQVAGRAHGRGDGKAQFHQLARQ